MRCGQLESQKAFAHAGFLAGDEQLYFLHIPKTGGTTLHAWLGSMFDEREVCQPIEPSLMLSQASGSLRRYRYISGHYGMFVLGMLDRQPRIITLLRDPLSRSISHYRDILSRPNHPLHAPVCDGGSFEHFVTSDAGEVELLNLQCRYLALDDLRRDYHGHEALRANDMVALRAKYSDSSMLDRALETLDAVDVIGFCEQLDTTATQIAEAFGWAVSATLPKLNAHRAPFDSEELTAPAVERVRELTELDQQLYTRAVASSAFGSRAMPSHISS